MKRRFFAMTIKVRLFTVVTLLSMWLVVAMAALWMRSYETTDVCAVRLRYCPNFYLLSGGGEMGIIFSNTPTVPGAAPFNHAVFETLGRHLTDVFCSWAFAGFGVKKNNGGPGLGAAVVVPIWLPMVLLLIPPGFEIRYQVRLARSKGLCPACRYDLRGVGDKCPECGAAITVKKS